MSTIHSRVTATTPGKVSTDLLLVGVFENSLRAGAAGLLDSSSGGQVSAQAQIENFTGKIGETSVQVGLKQVTAKRVLFFGLGAAGKLNENRLRDALVAAFKEVKRLKVTDVTVAEPSLTQGDLDLCRFAYLTAQVAVTVDYVINHYKTARGGHKPEVRLSKLVFLASLGQHQAVQSALDEGLVIGSSVNYARDLVNTPPCLMTPLKLADQARSVANRSNGAINLRVLGKTELEAHGFGGLLAVSQGSDQEPVLIEMNYYPQGADPSLTLAFIGKSVTFDSGGLDLKTADGMRNMKCDMAGGAATLAAVSAIAALGLPVRVMVLMAATENMTGPAAYKPGDVIIRTLGGLTVEVDNTDAEGRLTLADAIEWARRNGATHIVDAATLTGAVRMCCGSLGAGAFSNNQELLQRVLKAADGAGELLAALPFWDGFARANESSIADLKNSGGSSFGAGSATAAWFLRKFAADTPWVHMDIASVAFRESAQGADPAGGTGYGVRTFVEIARAFAGEK
ncbi:MAG: leucyl aminopeptidase [Candidatus Obscuribacterales bacterium]|nr:leucyl aminopeptidase [Candidatus Obscuribacterales bacterium]